MKRAAKIFLTTSLIISVTFNLAGAQNEIKIWKDFVKTLMADKMTLERIRPIGGASKETLLGWLKIVKEKVPFKELDVEPEFYRVDHLIHFFLPLTLEDRDVNYCFSFVMEGNTWYFHALETIFIRFDKMSSLPTSKFPDIAEKQKEWDREEWRFSGQVHLFNYFVREKGRSFAFDWFKDGAGYFLASKVRVPFFTPSRAFILYLCWEQANLRGNSVTLEKLTDHEAVVRMTPIYFALYQAASHLKDQISFEDYRRIFESVWQDRAEKAGWKLEIEYGGEYPGAICVLRFTR